jgi:YfiR/HmsC-like
MSLMLGVVPVTTWAQSVPESALKAAFLYNFAKFAEWPADAAPAEPLTICVLADAAIANALDETVKGRTIDARKVVVSRVKPDGLRACHVLYLTGLDGKRAQQIIEELQNTPVLTVSDGEQFAQNGGIAGLFVEQGRMRFAINLEAAQRARLRISSRLLSLAKIVKDEHAHP